MKLEIGNFYVRDIVFGNELSLKDGVLTVNKEEPLTISGRMRGSQKQSFILRSLAIRSGCVR